MSDEKLYSIDFEANIGTNEAQILEEFARLGTVRIIDVIEYPKGEHFIADITGLKGRYEFKVQGAETVYSIGADTLVNLMNSAGVDSPVMNKKTLDKLTGSKHFSKLKSAIKRHAKAV